MNLVSFEGKQLMRHSTGLQLAICAMMSVPFSARACDDHFTLNSAASVDVGYTPVGPLPANLVTSSTGFDSRFIVDRCCLSDQQILAGAAIHTATTPSIGPWNAKNISLLSNVPLASMGGGAGSSLYAWVDPLTKREYAIMGRSNGTAIIDVTDPYQPVYVANMPIAAGSVPTDWREPKVFGNYAFVGVDRTTHPMQVLDLTRLRGYSGTTMTLNADANFTGVTKIHTLAVNKQTGFLYASGTDKYAGGVMAINVNNPLAPVNAGGFSADGYTHETQVVVYNGPDIAYRGHEIAFNSNAKSGSVQDTFSIVDYTNKSQPARLSTKTYANAKWIHQGWLTEDQRYFFQDDESDETAGVTGGKTRTHLWDVSDLNNPQYRGYYDHTTTSIDHNLYVKGNYVYETNYTTGLRILEIGDLSSTDSSKWLKEVAYFDTYQPDDSATFNGAWNNYPFLPSGNVLVSDINGGLFVLRPQLGRTPPEPTVYDSPAFPTSNMTVPEPGLAGCVALAGVASTLRRRRNA
jgi:choice-of-anchor B domain-containing protein